MTQEDNRSMRQKWKEFWGRKKIIEPVPFTDTAIITQPITFSIVTPGYYLPLPALTAAVVTSAAGHKAVFTEGGYKEFQEGAYTIQYIDLKERFITLPGITASTIDGSEVSITFSLSYNINDLEEFIKVASPLQSLFSVCEAAVKNFILTHHYDELIGQPDSGDILADYNIIQYIKEQVAVNQACRAFSLMDVLIKERYGHPEINRLKHDRNVQKTQSLSRQEYLEQQQKLAEEQRKLDLQNAEKEREVLKIKAQSEAEQSEIREYLQRLSIELDRLRKLPDMQHVQAVKKIEAFERVLQALIEAQLATGVPRDVNQGKLLDTFAKSLADVQSITSQVPEDRTKQVSELGSTIINLIARKK